jgi:hypothetical protein
MTSISLSVIWPEAANIAPPWIWITQREVPDVLIDATPSVLIDGCIRRIRAERIVTFSDLHDEFSAAFQFPWYYGRNFNAALDCLFDLDWCESDHRTFVAIVTNAHSLVHTKDIQGENALHYVLDIAERIGPLMAEEYQWSYEEIRPPTAFKFVLQAPNAEAFLELKSSVERYIHAAELDTGESSHMAQRYGVLPMRPSP